MGRVLVSYMFLCSLCFLCMLSYYSLMLRLYTELRFYSCYTLVLIVPTRTLGFGARRPKQLMANFESVSLRYSILCSTLNKGATPAAQYQKET
jgi:hypothetical protein